MHNSLLRGRVRAALVAFAFASLTAGAVAVAAPATHHGASAAPAATRIGDSHIGSDDAGDTLAAWTRGSKSIEVSVQPAGQSAWSPSQALVQLSFPVGYWSLAVGRDGLALLVWERRIGAISTIWARTARLPGTSWSPAVRIWDRRASACAPSCRRPSPPTAGRSRCGASATPAASCCWAPRARPARRPGRLPASRSAAPAPGPSFRS